MHPPSRAPRPAPAPLAAGAVVALVSLASAPAAARTCAGVFLAESVEVAATPLRLNGAGVRRVSFKTRSGDADAILSAGPPRRLVLHFLRRTERARLTDGLGAHAVDRRLEAGLLGGACG